MRKEVKERLDILTVERGLAESRAKAQALIMSGQIYVNGQKEEKSGTQFFKDALIERCGERLPYVSRGGLKLDKAFKVFDISSAGKICLDAGASTGGFTDCMLQNGAKKVYSVDVGYGQFAWKLRNDPRVCLLEKTNLRYVTKEEISEPIGFCGCDVSFISITKILPAVYELLMNKADMICLIKPQFEAGREKVGKKGVVKDPDVHVEVISSVAHFASSHGFLVKNLSFSPIRGPEGNIEYLLHIVKSQEINENPYSDLPIDISGIVKDAHKAFETKGI